MASQVSPKRYSTINILNITVTVKPFWRVFRLSLPPLIQYPFCYRSLLLSFLTNTHLLVRIQRSFRLEHAFLIYFCEGKIDESRKVTIDLCFFAE